ncbi:MAG: acyl-CoA dehydrogenase family protein [Microbacterium sp.]
MSYTDSAEQVEIRATVRGLLARIEPIAAARAAENEHSGGFDRAAWDRLSAELGVSALLVPEEADGLGLTFEDACVVLEETGRAAYNGPVLESAVIVPLLLALSDQDVSEDWQQLVSGGAIATITGLGDWVAGREPSVTAVDQGGAWTLTGTTFAVPFGLVADRIYVIARAGDGIGVWVLAADASGHGMRALSSLDLTGPRSAHEFAATPARLVVTPSSGGAVLRLLAAQAVTALTAEQVGAIGHLLETTLEYLRTRYQFGRAIGSFQALKHRTVNMAIAAEGAAAASRAARTAVTAATGDDPSSIDEAVRLAAIAGAYCSDAAVDIAGAALQLHGGIGMSWEHDIHIYLRRLKASQRLFGAPSDHRRTLRDALQLASA